MKDSNNQLVKISILIVSISAIFISFAYAFINQTLIGTKKQVITAGNLELALQEENALTLENALPMYDEVGMIQKSYDFTLINKTSENTKYTLKLKDVTEENKQKLDTSLVKYGLTKDGVQVIDFLSNLENMIIDEGTLQGEQTIHYMLRLWIDSDVEDENLINGKSLSYKIVIEAVKGTYADDSNANVPELTSGMIPVMYSETTKKWLKADVTEKWFDYDSQWWANAVTVTEATRENYMSSDAGTPISMDDINTMWVWIPRYEYQYTDLGNQYAGGTQE